MPEPTTLGKRLKAFRLRAELTQQQLADRSGVRRTMISAVEAGHRKGMNVETLTKISRVLGVPIDQLVHGDMLETSMVLPGV